MSKLTFKYLVISYFIFAQSLFASSLEEDFQTKLDYAQSSGLGYSLLPKESKVSDRTLKAAMHGNGIAQLKILQECKLNSDDWIFWIDTFANDHNKKAEKVELLKQAYQQQLFDSTTFEHLFVQSNLKLTSDWEKVVGPNIPYTTFLRNGRHIKYVSIRKPDPKNNEPSAIAGHLNKSKTQKYYDRFAELVFEEAYHPELHPFNGDQNILLNHNFFIPISRATHRLDGESSDQFKTTLGNEYWMYSLKLVYLDDFDTKLRQNPRTLNELIDLLEHPPAKPKIKDPDFQQMIKTYQRITKVAPVIRAELALFYEQDLVKARQLYERIIVDGNSDGFAEYRLAELDLNIHCHHLKNYFKNQTAVISATCKKAETRLKDAINKYKVDNPQMVPFLEYRLASIYMGVFRYIHDNAKAEALLKPLTKHELLDHASLCHIAEIRLGIYHPRKVTKEDFIEARSLLNDAALVAGGEPLAHKRITEILLGKHGQAHKDISKAIKMCTDYEYYRLLYEIYRGDYGEEFKWEIGAKALLEYNAIDGLSFLRLKMAREFYYEGDIAESLLYLKSAAVSLAEANFNLAKYYGHPKSPGYQPSLAAQYFDGLRLNNLSKYFKTMLNKYIEMAHKNGTIHLWDKILTHPHLKHLVTYKPAEAAALEAPIIIEEEPEQEDEVKHEEPSHGAAAASSSESDEEIFDPKKPFVKVKAPEAAAVAVGAHVPGLFWPKKIEQLFTALNESGKMKMGELMALVKGLGCSVEPAKDPSKGMIKAPGNNVIFIFHKRHDNDIINFNIKGSYWKNLKDMLTERYESE